MTLADRWRIRFEAWRDSVPALALAMGGALLIVLALLTLMDVI